MTETLFEMNSDKAFMKYFGGKQYARKMLFECLPKGLTTIASPFVGGGSFELYCGANGIRVHGYDNFDALVRHWNIMFDRAYDVMKTVNEIFPVKPQILRHLIKEEKLTSYEHFPSPEKDLAFAALAICCQLQGFNGFYLRTLYFRGAGDEILEKKAPVPNPEEWRNWKNDNLTVKCQDWRETLKQHKNDFLFCDPPYVGKEELYGPYHTRKTKYQPDPFDHKGLRDKLAIHKGGFLLTYQDDEDGVIRELYKNTDFFHVEEKQWHQGSVAYIHGDMKRKTELFIRPAHDKRGEDKNIGDVDGISRVYGRHKLSTVSNPQPKPATLAEKIESIFKSLSTDHPYKMDIESIIRTSDTEYYGCSVNDAQEVVETLVKRGVIEKTESRTGTIYYGYPKFEVNTTKEHVDTMKELGVNVIFEEI